MGILNQIKKLFFAAPYASENIKQIKLKVPVEWFVRMNKDEGLEYQNFIGISKKTKLQ